MVRLSVTETLTPQRPRRVLGALDANRVVNPTPTSSKLQQLNNSTVKKKQVKKTPVKTKNTPDLVVEPTEQSPTAEERFRCVCLSRCSEEDEFRVGDDALWTLDDFEYLQPLGTGGSATVFKARERQSGFEVALKIQPASSDGFCEMDVHSSLSHPAIVKLYDHFYSTDTYDHKWQDALEKIPGVDIDKDGDDDEQEEFLVFILELCEEALFDAIGKGPNGYIEESKAASYFQSMVDAMDYLHSKDIIHCDIKTLNFLVTSQGHQLKLADFGMAVRGDEKEVVGGSPVYMAPEHMMAWKRYTEDFDQRSDLYSLGVVLYETLVGYLPYAVIDTDEDAEQIAEYDCGGPILDLRSLATEGEPELIYVPPPIFPTFISEEAQDLISQLMEPRPEDRISLEKAKEHPWFRMYGK